MTSPFQVVFPVGSVDNATQDVTINIHPDSALEGDHHFNVTLLESPYYVLEEPSNMIITIEDGRFVIIISEIHSLMLYPFIFW